MPTLKEYTAGRVMAGRCSICQLPEDLLSQVDENELLDRPVSRPAVITWLAGEGHVISETSVRRHALKCLGRT